MPEPDDALKLPDGMIARREGDAQSLIRREAEAWLVEQCRDTLHSSGQWPLETGSLEEYEESCASHRARWSRAVGEWSFDAPFDVQVTQEGEMVDHIQVQNLDLDPELDEAWFSVE